MDTVCHESRYYAQLNNDNNRDDKHDNNRVDSERGEKDEQNPKDKDNCNSKNVMQLPRESQRHLVLQCLELRILRFQRPLLQKCRRLMNKGKRSDWAIIPM